MINIRRNILHLARGNAEIIKALALALFYKHRHKSSTVKDYTINKIRKETGLAYCSIRRRIDMLYRLGFAKVEGKKNKRLLFTNMSSESQHRNVVLPNIDFNNIKDIENALWFLFFAEIQKKKDFVKQTIRSATNPKKLAEHKAAKKICNRCGYGNTYHEYGISYKKIAKVLGVCLQKAFNIVNWSVEQRLVIKEKKQTQAYCKGIGLFNAMWDNSNATFITKNNAYKIYANRYILCIDNVA